jgi:hypothetical protein
MRINVYDEEQTGRIEVVENTVRGEQFVGLRFFLELPVTTPHGNIQGPFAPNPVSEETAAVTFWNRKDLRPMLRHALALLDQYHGEVEPLAKLRDEIAALPGGTLGTCHQPVPPYRQDLIPVAIEALNKVIRARGKRDTGEQP